MAAAAAAPGGTEDAAATPASRLAAALRLQRATVCIDGNIGAGKSVVGRLLRERGLVTHNEPVDCWTLLPLYYGDPARFALAVQAQIITSYAGVGAGDDYALMERGPGSALGVFAQMLHDEGLLTAEAMGLLRGLHDALPLRRPQVVVYLHVPPFLCLERIARRGREAEESISEAYLARIDQAYERHLAWQAAQGVQVIRVDASEYDGQPAALADAVLRRLATHFCGPA